jgi:hypothetical protein
MSCRWKVASTARAPPQVLVIPQCGEGAVPGADPGHLLDAARKKRHRVRDEIPGQDEQIRLQRNDLVDVAPHVFAGHVDAGMDIGELNDAQRSAERQGELLDAVRLARVRSAVPGEEHRGRRDAAHPGLQETTPAKVHRRWGRAFGAAPCQPHAQASQSAGNLHQQEEQA